MSHNGYSLVVPDFDPSDIEANYPQPEEAPGHTQDIIDEEWLCSCFPSYEAISFCITHTWENLTDIFYEALYDEEENGKDV